MGIVYAARDRRSGKLAAVKVLRHAIAQQRQSEERFRREAQAIAGLKHSNIVPMIASGIEGDTAFLAMELIDGVTLTEVIEAIRSCGCPPSLDTETINTLGLSTPVSSVAASDCIAALIGDRNKFAGIASLGAMVADALHAAHRSGIFHRDVKPSNILLVELNRIAPVQSAVLYRTGGWPLPCGLMVGIPANPAQSRATGLQSDQHSRWQHSCPLDD